MSNDLAQLTIKGNVLRREYEFIIIMNAQLSEEETKKLQDKYEAIFLSTDGDVVTKSDWGVKKLAYSINKEFRGRYLFYDFIGNPKNLEEAQRLMRIDEKILRYLIVRIGEDADVDTRKAELAKAEAAIAAQRQLELA